MWAWPRPIIVVGLLAIVAAPWAISNQFYLLLLQLVGIGAIVTTGLNLVLGYAGQVSLGHAALFGVGAYSSAVLTLRYEWGFVSAALAAMVLAGLVGVLLGVPSLRLAGAYLAMATLAFNLIVQRLLVNWVDLTGGPDGLPGIPGASIGPLLFDRRTHWYLVVACAGVVYWLTANLIDSRHGRALLAIRDDEVAAESSGVAVYRAKLLAFGVSAVYAGLAGSLFAHLYRHVSPISFGLEASIEFLLAVLVGGPGRLGWPLLGVAIVTVIPQLPMLQALQQYRLLAYGGLLLGSVLVFRDGVGGLAESWRVTRRQTRAETDRDCGRSETREGANADAAERVDPDTLLRLLASRSAAWPSADEGGGRLELRGVGKRFGGVAALTHVDLTLLPATVDGLIGPNGSGKTTALNVISGVLVPDAGRIYLAGRDVTGSPAHRLAGLGVARTFQTVRLFGQLSVLDNILIGQQARAGPSLPAAMLHLPHDRLAERGARRAAASLAAALGLGPYLEHRADDLPHGQRRRVELARALASGPRLLLLDEPAAGLGADGLEELAVIIGAVKEAGIAVLLVEHHVELVLAVCDRLTVLEQGRVIAQGEPSAVIADSSVVEAYLGSAHAAGA